MPGPTKLPDDIRQMVYNRVVADKFDDYQGLSEELAQMGYPIHPGTLKRSCAEIVMKNLAQRERRLLKGALFANTTGGYTLIAVSRETGDAITLVNQVDLNQIKEALVIIAKGDKQ